MAELDFDQRATIRELLTICWKAIDRAERYNRGERVPEDGPLFRKMQNKATEVEKIMASADEEEDD